MIAGVARHRRLYGVFHTCHTHVSVLKRIGASRSGQHTAARPFSGASTKRATPPRGPLAATYDPDRVERDWYEWWEENDVFKPRGDGPAFSMTIPPPNVTGVLHIGHALTVALEDALVRWRRMCGDRVVWVPGLDHAGIATQSVVERRLASDQGVSRHQLGREAFVENVWAWYAEYGGRINSQLRELGASLDWSRQVFTMDEERSAAVSEAFVRLYDDGLVYRSMRLVNWCPYLQTVISDIEMEHITANGRTSLSLPGNQSGTVDVGLLHTFAYPLAEPTRSLRTLQVSTTRLETMLGDAAVAVHPEDARYSHLIGKFVRHPIHGTLLPIVGDAILVDPELGTGAVKVTPAHDPNDLECARRHGLPEVNLLNDDGTLNAVAGRYQGLDRFAARTVLINDLRDLGVYVGCEEHEMRLGLCSRSGDIIEPLLKPQWFVSCEPLGRNASALVRSGELDVVPTVHETTWHRWLDNVHDWCVSRQLWWGHRIPAYRVFVDGVPFRVSDEPADDVLWVVGRNLAEAQERARTAVESAGVPVDANVTLEQDEDVLDTWFSSALFPLSIFGWPGRLSTGDAAGATSEFYPLSVMETGHDILFFWVARMVMLCTHLTGVPPFKRIALHPIVRDKEGRKMSKSLGNVIDPLHVIHGVSADQLRQSIRQGNLPPGEEARALSALSNDFPDGIPPFGSDALRLALASYPTNGWHLNLDLERVSSTRLFGNKVWNATRFTLHHLRNVATRRLPDSGCRDHRLVGREPGEFGVCWLPLTTDVGKLSLPERYILSRAAAAATTCEQGFKEFDLHSGASAVRQFLQGEFCDIAIEWSKGALGGDEHEGEAVSTATTLAVSLDVGLRMLHPFMPFLTEELWQHLHGRVGGSETLPISAKQHESLAVAPFPTRTATATWRDVEAEEDMEVLLGVLGAARSLRKTVADISGQSWQTSASLMCVCDRQRDLDVVAAHAPHLRRLLKVGDLQVLHTSDRRVEAAAGSLSLAASTVTQVFFAMENNAETRTGLAATVKRLQKRADRLSATHAGLQARMSSEVYCERVPADVQARDAERLSEAAAQAESVRETLQRISSVAKSLGL